MKEFLACFLNHYGDNVLLAYGSGSIKKNGIYDEIMGILKAGNKTVTEFAGIMPGPTYEKVMEGAELAKENHTDVILAVGGGHGGKQDPQAGKEDGFCVSYDGTPTGGVYRL